MALSGPGISLIMAYLRNRELAQGNVAFVCRGWLQTHSECAWKFMVLTAGTADDLFSDLALLEAHTAVKKFLSAPRQAQERASRSAQSLTLKICQLEEFLDHYPRWSSLPFDRLKRLVLEGPNSGDIRRQLWLRDGLDVCRLGLVLAKYSQTVETLIVRAEISVCGKDNSDDIVAFLVANFKRLAVLDLPCAGLGLGLYPPPQVAQWALLQSCQGLSVDFGNLDDSWLSRVPRLKRLHISICSLGDNGFESLEIGVFVKFLADKCPLLEYLKFDFIDSIIVRRDAFAHISERLKRLVLSFDDPCIGGLQVAFPMSSAGVQAAEQICTYLRPCIPSSCVLFVLNALWQIGIEEVGMLNAQYAVSV